MKKHILRLAVLMLCLVCALSAFRFAAYAVEPIDLERDVSVTATFKYGETLIPNAEFSIYYVAETTQWAVFRAAGYFADYTGKLNGLYTAAEWDKTAKELAQYITDHQISPLHKGRTDSQGQVSFSGNMKPGLYLLTCKEAEYNGKIYSSLPCLISLPNLVVKSDVWVYDDAQVIVKGGDVRDKPTPPDNPPDLPQTGMLLWPIPVLLVCGLLALVVGLTRRRSCRDEA